jgi:predicted lipoprotein with Yx(FWY)xxD motif
VRIALATASAAALLVGTGMVGVSAGAPAVGSKHEGGKISLRHTHDGTVLVGENGHSLYAFSIDTKNHSNCKGACLKHWIPAMTSGKPRAGAGVKAAHLGQTRKHQATYFGQPLYTFVKDTKSGQVKGQNLFASGGYWNLVKANGKLVF